MNRARFFFYLLLFLLPTQLGRHFFLPFSFISGVRSSYLAPTIYLTDIIILIIITLAGVFTIKSRKSQIQNHKSQIKSKSQYQNFKRYVISNFGHWNFGFWVLFISYLLFTSFFIAHNQWAAVYKTAKIVELVLLGWAIVNIRPRISSVVFFLSLAGLYSAIIGIAQFALQHSIGGWLWWAGERTFYASTPAIATISLNGAKALRSYATFPHPNVFGGFLAIVIPWVLSERKKKTSWYYIGSGLGSIALLLTFSRVAWIVALVGIIAGWKKSREKAISWMQQHILVLSIGTLLAITVSLLLPLLWNTEGESARQRTELLSWSWRQFASSPLPGIGLNNALSTFFPFQPVHNVFVLLLTEIGIIGTIPVLWVWWCAYRRSLLQGGWLFIVMMQMVLLGLFDHYLVTLQQGMLLSTVVLSLVFLPKNTVR